jgi:phasin family protein
MTQVAAETVSEPIAPAALPEPVQQEAIEPAPATPVITPLTTPMANLATATLKEHQMTIDTNSYTNTPNFGTAGPALEHAAADAMAQGKAGYEAMTGKAKEMMEGSMKQMGELTEFAKGNVEAMVASAKAATAGAEVIASAVVEHGKKNFEATSSAVKQMTGAKTPNELMQLQNDFAKSQFEHGVAMWSKLSETMLKLAGDVTQPLSSRMAIAAEQMKATVAAR